jgi:acetyl-CoA C-acetyltransferase
MDNEAVVVATAHTAIGRAYKGSFNATRGADLAGHVVGAALARARIEGEGVDDVILGCGYPEGLTGTNIARHAALRA